jgi:hypothetical protein
MANKTADISRDLLNVAADRNGAAVDLRDDLANFSGSPPPPHLLDALSTQLVDGLRQAKLDDQTASVLAEQLFVSTNARELSDRQVQTLRQDVVGTLSRAGVPREKAEPVGQTVGEIQTAITANRRRWWHWR